MEIRFQPANPDYANLFLEYRQDPETQRYNPLQTQSLEELRTRLSNSCSDWSQFKNNDNFFWFISDGDQIVGTASLHSINRMMLTAEIGYGVFSRFRGKGVAKRIVQMLTQDVFHYTNLRKLIAYVHEDNFASKRVLEKNQYMVEGLLREHYIVNGMPANEVIYGVLRREIKRV